MNFAPFIWPRGTGSVGILNLELESVYKFKRGGDSGKKNV